MLITSYRKGFESIVSIFGYRHNPYRFAFNGKEKDDEIKGAGNSYDFGARIYDPRIGRFLSIDPLWKQYTTWSPYTGFNNNPIIYNDPAGKGGELTINTETKKATLTFNMQFYGEEGYSLEEVQKLVYNAFPNADKNGTATFSTTSLEKWTYNNVEYDLTVNVNITVMHIDDVDKALAEKNASYNFFEVRNNSTGRGGRNKSPYNVGFIDAGAFLQINPDKNVFFSTVKNTILDELWHSIGAIYPAAPANPEQYGNHSQDDKSVCSSHPNDNEVRKVQKDDMNALARGTRKMFNLSNSNIYYLRFKPVQGNNKKERTTIIGGKADKKVDSSFQHSN